MYTLEQAVGEIKNWAEERGLVNPDFKNKQLIKLLEEVGETAGAILKRNESKTVDGVGDIFVVISILCFQSKSENAFKKLYTHTASPKSNENDLFEILYLCNRGRFADALILLSDFSVSLGYDLSYCVNIAYHDIKDRKGKLVGGSFIKENQNEL
jgi:NTP pyrophosphatase (non-canonical NTP hydrolase)